MNNEEHVSQERLLDYTLRNEYAMENESVREIEQHISSCEPCRIRYHAFQERYQKLQNLPAPEEHIRQLTQKPAKNMKTMIIPWYLKAAAGLAFLFILYGAASGWMNYRFDHGEAGLADCQKDYAYALDEDHYRGGGFREREDIKDFKTGVRLLFDSRETTLGLFPGYNEDKMDEAEKYFNSAYAKTNDELLKRKITDYKKKIGLMKKEIKK